MTKDGRPSRINDIRLFAGSAYSYLEGFAAEVAFARRLAWWLNGLDVRIGTYTALYVWFTENVAAGHVELAEQLSEWWFRQVKVGVAANFPESATETHVAQGIIAGLKTAAPKLTDDFDHSVKVVTQHEGKLRFLLKSRETKRYKVEVTSTIEAWPSPSLLFVSLHDKETGLYFEAPPAEVPFYRSAWDLRGTVKVTDLSTSIRPKTSLAPQIITARPSGDLTWSLSDFREAERPVVSGLLNLR